MRRLPGACLWLVLLLPNAAAGQLPAAPYLPQDHWAHTALRRLAVHGAAELYPFVARRTLTRAEALWALDSAASAAVPGAEGAVERFLSEFPLERSRGDGEARTQLTAAVGLERHDGGLFTGTGYGRDDIPAQPPVPGGDFSGPTAWLQLSGRAGSRLAGVAAGGYGGEDWTVTSAHVVAAVGPTLVWGGRRPVGYGPGAGGGLVLGDWPSVDGGGVQLRTPLIGRGVLRWLGPVHIEALLARMETSGTVENPLFLAMRGSFTPHPRLLLGLSRGAFFGGDNLGVSLRDVLYLLIGKHGREGSSWENQIVALDATYRLPLPIPTEAYIEWGFEDSAGAWREVPGVLWGVAVTGLPGWSEGRLGVEHTEFAGSCCGNPIWYRHIFLHGGWTADGFPLGHPLGGHGEEWLLFATRGLVEERLQLRGSLALRERRHENLYAPDRQGRSRAGAVRVTYVGDHWQLISEAALESGGGWNETLVRAIIQFSP